MARAGAIPGAGGRLAEVNDDDAKYIRMKIRNLVAENTESTEEPAADVANDNRAKPRGSPITTFRGREPTLDAASGSGSDRSRDGKRQSAPAREELQA